MCSETKAFVSIAALFFVTFITELSALVLLSGCGASLGQLSIGALNSSAALANTAAPGVLRAQCQAELAAVVHQGEYVNGHCVRTDAPRVATDAERAALIRVRAQWAPVRVAYEMFATAHDQAASLSDGASLLKVVQAYEELRRVVAELGVQLPATGASR